MVLVATHCCFMLPVISDNAVLGRGDPPACGCAGWGSCDDARLRRTLRLRGGFKAKWGEKYIAGLTTKRVSKRERCRVHGILLC